ncbi:hypothetical protein [Nocardia sp. NPDC051463]|uniref:hypothetical protein n=1 Tax=Nocardia sp. NPDC051463 TaxID=3154845 RepID=UPI00344DD0CA
MDISTMPHSYGVTMPEWVFDELRATPDTLSTDEERMSLVHKLAARNPPRARAARSRHSSSTPKPARSLPHLTPQDGGNVTASQGRTPVRNRPSAVAPECRCPLLTFEMF